MDGTLSQGSLCDEKIGQEKGFYEWRQPLTPEPPKSPLDFGERQSEAIHQNKSLCGVKDLSRLSRKRRTFVVTKNGRVCSRKRHEDKETAAHNESKPRITKKEPIPMRLRSLPQSFFQQPNSIRSGSYGQNTYSRLPPLYPQENNPDEETTERPVTPPEERKEPKPAKRIITSQPDTELLFSLFDTVLPNQLEKKVIKRGRPKKVHSLKSTPPNPNHEEDPCMVENVMGKLFPQLSLENKHKLSHTMLASISIQNGNNCIELPTIAVENNYPQMLRDIALVL